MKNTEEQNLTPEEIMHLKQLDVVSSNQGYIKGLEIALKNIKKLKPTDRLEYASSLTRLIIAIKTSIDGWEKWCDPITMNGITMNQFKIIFPKMKQATETWLEIDKYITKAKTEQLKEEMNKTIDKNKPEKLPFYNS